jgi:pantoate--beta-alanine ligase
MGALHEAHLSLIDVARRNADRVAVSIFVNPTQFAPGEDLERYPRDRDGDLSRCRAHCVDMVFIPDAQALYSPGECTRVTCEPLSRGLCGRSRPGHFQGVCTVVSKLFALSGPCSAVFGRKDYQQWKIIERMTRDLFYPITVLSAPIVREQDGLALSSRNRLMSGTERRAALGLVRGLALAQRAYSSGTRAASVLESTAREAMDSAGLRVDYAEAVDAENLVELEGDVPERTLLAVAAYSGAVRQIDNVVLGQDALLESVP